jgi:single-strand DNA-binding protein
MYSIVNKIQLIGKVSSKSSVIGNKPNQRLSASIAVKEIHTNNKGETIAVTQHFTVVFLGDHADRFYSIDTFEANVCIDGRLVNRNYIDSNGKATYLVEIQVLNYMVLGIPNKFVKPIKNL